MNAYGRLAGRMGTKFEKILCPVEFDQNSAAAVRFACELAEPSSKIYLLHVIPEIARQGTEMVSSTLNLACECLEDFAREQLAGGVNSELLVRCGDPADVILKAANELDADVIVMATHWRKGLRRVLLGSVAERVVREARPPVLTVRPEITVQPKSA
jgi:universal stress protein A